MNRDELISALQQIPTNCEVSVLWPNSLDNDDAEFEIERVDLVPPQIVIV